MKTREKYSINFKLNVSYFWKICILHKIYIIFINNYIIFADVIFRELTMAYILGNEELLNNLSDNQKNNTYWTLLYVKSGAGMYLLDDSLRCLNEGDLMVLPPRVSYSFAADDLGDEYNININAVVLRFDNSWLDTVLSAFPVFSDAVLRVKELRAPLAVSGPKWIKLSSLLEEALFCDLAQQPVKVIEILWQLSTPRDYVLIKDIQECDTQTVAEKKAKIDRYLECNFCNRLTLEDISGYVGMSRTYFCQFFKTQYKEGFSDHLTRVRIEKASTMLLHTDKPIPEIAVECGFKTVQYFTRAFKKVKGTTPGAFRKKA